MRVLTAKEVNFVSGGFDPFNIGYFTIQDGTSGGFRGTGMPQTSGNSIGDVNYSPPTQEEACSNAADLKDYGLVAAAGALIPGAQGVAVPLSVSLQGLGGALSLLNGCN